MTQRTSCFLFVLSLALVPACGDGDDPGSDDGGRGPDAASIDAGPVTPDAATPLDAAALDDGAIADGGSTGEDAGTMSEDAATANDSGPSRDAGSRPDARVTRDAGPPSDCGRCAADEYCDLCPSMRGCVTRPMDMGRICPSIFMPVCGCDGRTYSNGCVLGSAGIPLLHDGACEDVSRQ